MTSDSFNQLFDKYLQQVSETSTASVKPDPTGDKPTWLFLLQRHVQEWKQHYRLESQAIEQIKSKSQRFNSQVDRLSFLDQDQAIAEVTTFYDVKRELIRDRQQQELTELGLAF
ncbi:hypothetical protein [Spirosoma flavum]|uniref:Uncharacterized protein n=1 Tax=Spirosoma flavum TaxID=2048557 RepID=A0ABW6AG41_9BACT